MITNYGGQPLEPVLDMQERIKQTCVMYEEVDALRIQQSPDGYKFASVPYGVLRLSADDPQFISRLCRKLNADETRGMKYSYVTEGMEDCRKYLPAECGEPKTIKRLMQRLARTNNVTPLFYPLFIDLHDIAETLHYGMFLCRYADKSLPIKLQVFAESDDGLALVQFMYSLKPDPIWKFAIIDTRKEYTRYCFEEDAKQEVAFDYGTGVLTQGQIDKLVGFQLSNL
jgi:hypothetical protein